MLVWTPMTNWWPRSPSSWRNTGPMTDSLPPLVDTSATRLTLHKLAENVLAADQVAANGDYRLVTRPDGFATSWFTGPDQVRRRVRVEGVDLIRETDESSEREPIAGAFDPAAASVLYAWWDLGSTVLAELAGTFGPKSSDIVLYPEHFDVASTVDLDAAGSINLGFSPGDDFSPTPYVYAGPWSTPPGDFWNAPFGAFRRYDEFDPADAANGTRAFLETAIATLQSSTGSGTDA
jgi:hypothetical protein